MVSHSLNPVRRRRAAFTLLEMLVALLIGGMVLAMAAGALRAALFSVGDVAADVQRGDRGERVRALLSTQIAWIRLNDTRNPYRFAGAADALDFATFSSLAAPHLKDVAHARYRVTPDPADSTLVALEYREAVPVSPGFGRARAESDASLLKQLADDDPKRLADAAYTPPRLLLRGLRKIEFAYMLYQPGGATVYEREWRRDLAPRALRVTLTDRNGREDRWVIPVAATF